MARDKIEAAIDRVEEAEAIPAAVVVQFPVGTQAHQMAPGQFLRLQPKPSKEPSLMVWIAELGYYQPVLLPPGTEWVLTAEEQQAPPAPKLWLPQ